MYPSIMQMVSKLHEPLLPEPHLQSPYPQTSNHSSAEYDPDCFSPSQQSQILQVTVHSWPKPLHLQVRTQNPTNCLALSPPFRRQVRPSLSQCLQHTPPQAEDEPAESDLAGSEVRV